jgi:hypothetical protein
MAAGAIERVDGRARRGIEFWQRIRDLADDLCIDFEEGEITLAEFARGVVSELDLIRMQRTKAQRIDFQEVLQIAGLKARAVLKRSPRYYSDLEKKV